MSDTYKIERDALKKFDEFFDEIYPKVNFGGLPYLPSDVLKNVDPIAYREEFLNWCNSEGIDLDPKPEETDFDEDKF